MLDFSDKPYQYFPPKRNGLVAWMLRWYNRLFYLPKVARVSAVEVCGTAGALPRRHQDNRLLFLPNHPTHGDPYIYFEALRQVGISTLIMAAYDVFIRRRRDAWIMQRFGAFSVDREGSDARAMKQAMATLTAGRHALTIFPEGNVYLQNDTVTPFHDGAALLGLRSAKELAPIGVRVLVVPVSIKATYVNDVRQRVKQKLHELAQAVGEELDDQVAPLEALRRVGRAALAKNLRQRGMPEADAPSLPELIRTAAGYVLDGLEQKMSLTLAPDDSPIDRVRKARRVIHQLRIDQHQAADHTVARTWADQAMFAHRILSYSGDYVEANATVDRVAETVEKLAEDIYASTMPPFGLRHAFVRFNEPIDLTDYLESFSKKARVAVRDLTERVEQIVQQGLDEINGLNPHPGGTLWEDSA